MSQEEIKATLTREVKQVEIYRMSCPTPGCRGYDHDYTATVESFLAGKEDRREYSTPWMGCHICELMIKLVLDKTDRTGDKLLDWSTIIVPMRKEYVKETGILILRSANTDGANPIYLMVVDDLLSKYVTNEELLRHKKYHYEEHTCPTNWIRGIEVISYNGDHDPHGVFELIGVFRPNRFEEITGITIEHYIANRRQSNLVLCRETIFEQLLATIVPTAKEDHEQSDSAE